MNGHKISVDIVSTDQSDEVLEKVMQKIELPDEFVYYFGLYLVRKELDGEMAVVRKLQDFESPYISLRAVKGQHRIVIRKSYWDPSLDDDLMNDRIAMNLLYVQAISDVERGWINIAPKETHKQLASLQTKGSKKEYLRLVKTLKYYGFMHFKPCLCDYPNPMSKVLIAAGNRELNFRIQVSKDQIKEGSFRVTRMRCWRITTATADGASEDDANSQRLELSFEYLMSKDHLQWITVYSEQAILISMCLQSMVDELLMKKQGGRIRRPQDRTKRNSLMYLKRDGRSNYIINGTNGSMSEVEEEASASQRARDSMQKIADKFSNVSLMGRSAAAASGTHPKTVDVNKAFENIVDDDL